MYVCKYNSTGTDHVHVHAITSRDSKLCTYTCIYMYIRVHEYTCTRVYMYICKYNSTGTDHVHVHAIMSRL